MTFTPVYIVFKDAYVCFILNVTLPHNTIDCLLFSDYVSLSESTI